MGYWLNLKLTKIFKRGYEMPLTHIDCFSGPGGICTGMQAAGFNTLIAIEHVKSCCETYSANHPNVHVIQSDIRDVTKNDIVNHIPKGGVDLVTSGMPCETFSNAGTTSRSFYDDRQFLFREGIRIAKLSNAKMILFENVPAIATKTVAPDSKELIVDVLKWLKLIFSKLLQFWNVALSSVIYFASKNDKSISFKEIQ